jgi:hypothetical protein
MAERLFAEVGGEGSKLSMTKSANLLPIAGPSHGFGAAPPNNLMELTATIVTRLAGRRAKLAPISSAAHPGR